MGVSISGLVSNMDTDAIVAALVSGYTVKKESYEKAQTKLEWKQEAWKDLNTKIKNFYSNHLSNMRFSTAFNKKTSVVSGSQATVTASNDAVVGTQRLKVKQLATSGYLTGGVIAKADGGKVSNSTKMSELGITDGKLSLNVNGKETTIILKADATVGSVVTQLKEAGVNASFDEKNQRFFVSSKASGKGGDFQLMAADTNGSAALKTLGLAATTAKDIESYKTIAAWDVDAKVDAAYAKQMTAQYVISAEAENEGRGVAQKLLDGLKAENATANKELESVQKQIEELNKKTEDGGTLTDEEQTKLEELTQKKTALEEKVASNQTLIDSGEVYLGATKDGVTSTEFEQYVADLNTKIDASNAALKTKLTDEYTSKKQEAQKYVDAYEVVNAADADKTSPAYQQAAELLGMTSSATGATRIEGQDAIIELNGATFTSNTNTFQVNGLTITANAETAKKDLNGNIISDEEVTITTDTDTQGIYDMIKGFMKEYNSLIIEMDKLYGAESSKGYEPLTDDEKEAMSDDEVEKWEKKIKDSLLRRDSTLDSVINSMKNAMQMSMQIDGKTYNLSSFGIKTLSYFSAAENEKGAYHIDGDKDDVSTSGNSDRLMAMIGTDPETVATYFNKLATNMYNNLNKKMQSSTLSSAFTIYNDKQMKTEQNEYKKLISQWEDKITTYEDRYRKQFAAMESALASLNAQQSQLGGLFAS